MDGLLPCLKDSGKSLIECLVNGGVVFSCGNGGSATTAQHLTEELSGRFRSNRRSLAGICLAADASVITCIANDFGFEEVFARQVSGLGKAGDALVAFSTGGTSPNVLRALRQARSQGLKTILVSGKDGGPAAAEVDHALIMPSDDTARIQELHTFVLHFWLEMVEACNW